MSALLIPGRPGFALKEFRYWSSRLGRMYYPAGLALGRLQRTAEVVLFPLRERFGPPIHRTFLGPGLQDRDHSADLW